LGVCVCGVCVWVCVCVVCGLCVGVCVCVWCVCLCVTMKKKDKLSQNTSSLLVRCF